MVAGINVRELAVGTRIHFVGGQVGVVAFISPPFTADPDSDTVIVTIEPPHVTCNRPTERGGKMIENWWAITNLSANRKDGSREVAYVEYMECPW